MKNIQSEEEKTIEIVDDDNNNDNLTTATIITSEISSSSKGRNGEESGGNLMTRKLTKKLNSPKNNNKKPASISSSISSTTSTLIIKPKKIIKIERDYTNGESCQFNNNLPKEINERISPIRFKETINRLNELLEKANNPKYAVIGNILECLTIYTSTFCLRSNYDKMIEEVCLFLDDENINYYNRLGLNFRDPFAINDKEKAIVVAFRGTANVKSFLNDLEFLQVPFFDKSNNAKVHSGFLATYNDTRTEITNLVKKLVAENPDYKVVTTGHSLGGSLAVFQTLDLIGVPGLNPSNLLTYTYGEPRTGDKNFAALVEKTGFSFFRVVNKADLVPHVPPQAFKYQHHDPEDKTCANSQKLPNINLINHAKYFDTVFLLTCLKK
ncbi:11468_t:CDS:10 [Entrophospora sp. SA101]|nr:11468_t:CDS:10 [Entrophospora sp. SA101]